MCAGPITQLPPTAEQRSLLCNVSDLLLCTCTYVLNYLIFIFVCLFNSYDLYLFSFPLFLFIFFTFVIVK